MSELNGKPPPDINLLTPNDYRRLRVALDGRDPRELLGGEIEDIIQTLTLAYKLREDPSFTWEAAGDIAPGEMFDMTGREPDPQMSTPTAAGTPSGSNAESSSRRKPRSSTSALPSAPSSASAETSTTS